MSSPSVLLYGNFEWFHLATSYQRGFEQVGCKVIPFDTRKMSAHLAPWTRGRVLHRLTIRSLLLRRLGARRWNREFIARVEQSRPSFTFILNGDFLMPETMRRVRALGTRVFIFHADNPFPPHYANRPETLPCALEADCYFLWSRQLVQQIETLGVKRAHYLGFAWDEQLFPHAAMAAQPEHDLVFIGGWDHEREEWLSPLARRFNLKIWGPAYWQTRTRPNSPLRACWQGEVVLGPDASRVIANSKIVLNVLRAQNLPDGVIMRTFEVPGCGGFMLSTRTQGATEIFPETTSGGAAGGAYFGDMDECCRQIEHYLNHETERRAIAARSHEVVSHGHTFRDRARHILSVAEECS